MPTINRTFTSVKQVPYTHDKEPSSDYYNTKGWKLLRNSYIREHPLCERCLKLGRTTPAEEVHHIKPFMSGSTPYERSELLLDPRNLIAVCLPCHHELHRILRSHKRGNNL